LSIIRDKSWDFTHPVKDGLFVWARVARQVCVALLKLFYEIQNLVGELDDLKK